MNKTTNAKIHALGAAIATALLAFSSMAVETGSYKAPAPDEQKYNAVGTKGVDGDNDGELESGQVHYKNEIGRKIIRYTYGENTWAWAVIDQPVRLMDVDNNHVIVDSDCDGRFDQRFHLREDFFLPPCAKTKWKGGSFQGVPVMKPGETPPTAPAK
ncbi:MAG: hypothetical protein KDG50_04370 [Chromatiales bacterium]|nr:hypothetical protein [Chromatiales bacterium]